MCARGESNPHALRPRLPESLSKGTQARRCVCQFRHGANGVYRLAPCPREMAAMRLAHRHCALLAMAALPACCFAQTRWCSISGKGVSAPLLYPPVARAAHITGTVIERITFRPEGAVLGVEPVLGPRLIASPIATQLRKCSFKTNAKGAQPCLALIVANFVSGDSDSSAKV